MLASDCYKGFLKSEEAFVFLFGGIMKNTAAFVSTFHARPGLDRLLEYDLQRLVSFTRREPQCVSCEITQSSRDKNVFIVHSAWSSRDIWLTHGGWQKHPAGIGMMDLCLERPIKITAMKEVA